MKKPLLKIAPIAMLALAACNNSETPTEGEDAEAAEVAEVVELPPAIVKSDAYRCADGTILYVDFYGREGADGKKLAASIHVGDKNSPAVRVEAPKAEAVEEGEAIDGASDEAAAPDGPMKSADGETTLAGDGGSINVKLSGKGAQSCKA